MPNQIDEQTPTSDQICLIVKVYAWFFAENLSCKKTEKLQTVYQFIHKYTTKI